MKCFKFSRLVARACEEICVRQEVLKFEGRFRKGLACDLRRDCEVVQDFFPFWDWNRPLLRGFVKRHEDQFSGRNHDSGIVCGF